MNSAPMHFDMPTAARNRPHTLRRWMLRTGLTGLLFIGFAFLFYNWENYRAERAWQKFKRDLMALGQRFDPDDFTLPPVPDAQNFLKAPLIEDWFACYRLAPGTSPTGNFIRITRPGDADLIGAWNECRPTDLKEWREHFRGARSKTADATRIEFQAAKVQPETEPPASEATTPAPPAGNASDEFVLLIVFDDVPLADALRNLARQAKIDVVFDPSVFEMTHQGAPLLEVAISNRFENVTVREAMEAVLGNYGLALVRTPSPGRFQITQALAPAPVWPNESADLPAAPLHSALEVLESFKPFADEFRALYAACERPQSRIDLDYRRVITQYPTIFNFTGYREVAQALTLHASAELSLSNSPVALQDATASFRLANTLKGQPDLAPAMMQVALAGLYLQVVWEGLAARRWDDAQLRTLGAQLASIDLLADCSAGFEAQQAGINCWFEQEPPRELAGKYVEQMLGYNGRTRSKPIWCEPVTWALRWGPHGWIRQLQIGYTQMFQDCLAQLDVLHDRVCPIDAPASRMRPHFPKRNVLPIAVLAHRYGFNAVKPLEVTARQQTAVNQARIACALERYRLAHGDVPDALAQLPPQFIEQLPHDMMNGRPFQYRRVEDGQFVLYSAGWDEKDDAASWADWVWRYPDKQYVRRH